MKCVRTVFVSFLYVCPTQQAFALFTIHIFSPFLFICSIYKLSICSYQTVKSLRASTNQLDNLRWLRREEKNRETVQVHFSGAISIKKKLIEKDGLIFIESLIYLKAWQQWDWLVEVGGKTLIVWREKCDWVWIRKEGKIYINTESKHEP